MSKAIIIDDVPQARKTLQQDLEIYCPDIQIIGTAEGVVSGAKLLKKEKPDILFLDIQMKDGSGFDLLDLLTTIDFHVIFTTASDAFAIKAFRYAAIDYLLKPIDPEELMEAVDKAKNTPVATTESFELLKSSIQEKTTPKKLALHTQEKIHITTVEDIIRCESNGNYTQFFFLGGDKLLVTKTLKEYDKLLSEQQFIRVHQSHLVNPKHIKAFLKIDGGYLSMVDGAEVPVSSRKKAMVLEAIGGM